MDPKQHELGGGRGPIRPLIDRGSVGEKLDFDDVAADEPPNSSTSEQSREGIMRKVRVSVRARSEAPMVQSQSVVKINLYYASFDVICYKLDR